VVAENDGGKRFTATFKTDVILRMRRKLRGFGATVCKTPNSAQLSDRCLSACLSVCNVGVLWQNGWMDQDETWRARRTRP